MPQSTHKRLDLLSDLSERVRYNLAELPIYASRDPLSIYADYRCPCHWHRDLEYIHVISGTLHYFVNGEVFVLRPGEGLVVNANRLHYGFSPGRLESWFSCAVISPSLVESLTGDVAARCERAFDQHRDDAMRLSPNVPWQFDVLAGIDRLVVQLRGDRRKAAADSGTPIDPLPAVATAIGLLDAVLDRFGSSGDDDDRDADEQRRRIDVLNMTGLIQQRFAAPLSLDDIAAAGRVSRSQCCMLFKRYVGHTPNEYLTERRVEEAKRLLAGTDGSIAEIARACGFSSASYFISVFRRRLGATPKEYRLRFAA
ncbi:AraC family transcriptional regulator [Bifidobacterium simiiventris]|uniref:AraC family transcriptional regulator n=1 Tax=Bifidobacterium simiiventris TaxID=2834434 RepID=UPI001C57E22D|nr:AraC family transcriptional regulator [Bifidobacterium simiiventris]MBW3077805.1 AraC family transcriptional regulator [Bifidobacterium simiiventris]